jgi:hypothetical protein
MPTEHTLASTACHDFTLKKENANAVVQVVLSDPSEPEKICN